MLNLKLALLATTAAGAVTAGGIAVATVSDSSAPTKAKTVADTAAKTGRNTVGKAPAAPSCLPGAAEHAHGLPKAHPPKDAKLPKAKLPDAKVPDAKVPDAKVPDAKVPDTKVPGGKVADGKLPPAAQPGVHVPSTPLPSGKPKLPVRAPGALPQARTGTGAAQAPADLPTCLPSSTPSAPSVPLPPVKPGAGLPKPPAAKLPSCETVPPAITVVGSQAKGVTLPAGLRLVSAHARSLVVRGQQVCENVEKFAGSGDTFLTVESVRTPPQTTLGDLATALKLPNGKVVSLGGIQTVQNPLGTGVAWLSGPASALALTSSPDLVGRLPGIVAQLPHTK